MADEFRLIRSFHDAGEPYRIKTRVAVLHYWGSLRSWTLSGHFHETYMHDLIHINVALSGLPVDVKFISFEDVKNGILKDVDVVINAGRAGSAWSGGDAWKDEELVTALTKWVHEGGCFIGVNEPSAVEGYDTYFRMAHVLGIDEDTGARVCHGRWTFETADPEHLIPEGADVEAKENRYLTDGKAQVLLADGGKPLITLNHFGKGLGIYLSSFQVNLWNTRMLYQLIRYAGGEGTFGSYMTDNLYTECAYYPESKKLVVINNSDTEQRMHNEKERPTEYFPDGTPIDDWFYDIGMPELEELGRPYVLTEYGIWDDGKVYTKEIQKVIDLAAEEGGGVLVVPPGTYLTGALYFKQGVNLYVSAGATLKGSDDISDYDLAETRIEGETCLYFTALINADGLNGFTMCGPGTIDGNGLKTWKARDPGWSICPTVEMCGSPV